MSKPTVLITGPTPRSWLSDLEPRADVSIWPGDDLPGNWSPANGSFLMPRDQLLTHIGEFDAVLNFAEIKADAEFVGRATRLKILANASIGHDNLDLPLLTERGIWASNAPGFFTAPVAEYALAGILAVSRRLLEADAFVRQGNWQAFEPGRWDGVGLRHKTVGLVGLGTIGRELRRLALALGATVIYHTPTPKDESGWVPFDELVQTADVLSIHVPLTSATRKLFSRAVIAQLKPGAIVVNTSRGLILDQNALIDNLLSGRLGGAVLDVFQDEPHVPDALRAMNNVLLTPHIAGGTRAAREGCLRRASQNIADVLRGQKPRNALNALNVLVQ